MAGRLRVPDCDVANLVTVLVYELLLGRVRRASDTLAVYAVAVDAKDERAQAFYEHFGFIALSGAVRRLFLPTRTLERLFDR